MRATLRLLRKLSVFVVSSPKAFEAGRQVPARTGLSLMARRAGGIIGSRSGTTQRTE
jgi:hypothetical protein